MNKMMKSMLTHVAMVAVSCATFNAWADAPTLSVENVSFRQRYPWNGLVDIDCTVNCSDPQTNISLYVSAKEAVANKSLAVRSVWLENDATHTNALEVKSGTHRLVWDACKDNPNFVCDAVTVEVQACVGGFYLVIDLSGGSDATFYPVTYIGDEPLGGWTDEYKTTKLVLRRIPPGIFVMGSPPTETGRISDDSPCNEIQHEVTISEPFFIGVFEITQKQYQLVTGSNPSCYKGDMRPVENVSWNTIRGSSSAYNWPASSGVDPYTFMGKIRAKTGINTFDLPTQAKWEYACRAGTQTALNSGKDFSAQNLEEIGRFDTNKSDGKGGYASAHTTVGSYKPNLWGLYDMSGNVFEWCLDWCAAYDSKPAIDPVGPLSGTGRVRRGGSWYWGGGCGRSAYRWYSIPSGSWDNYGFRLCCSALQ